jgi:hypothetical protein
MMQRGLLATIMLLAATAVLSGAAFHRHTIELPGVYAQGALTSTLDAPMLTQTHEYMACMASQTGPFSISPADWTVQRRLDVVGVPARVAAYTERPCSPTAASDVAYFEITMSINPVDDVALLAPYLEVFIVAAADWPRARMDVVFYERTRNFPTLQLSFMIWDALALQEARFSGAELLAQLVDRPLAGPRPVATPRSPGDPTPCPPAATPERFATAERDLILARLQAAQIDPLHVSVTGFQNCPDVMTPDRIGWIAVTLEADAAATDDALGAMARAVILAAADWPEAQLYLTYTTVPSNESLYRISVPVRLALAYTQLNLTDEALFFGLRAQEAASYD